MNFFKWLSPGLKVKRWVLLVILGILSTLFGTIIILGPYRLAVIGTQSFEALGEVLGSYSRYNGIFFLVLGVLTFWYGSKKIIKSVVSAILPDEEDRLVQILDKRRQQKVGPKIVALGGGTGLPNLLRGLKPYTQNITAVVTVSDDGGSSGKLRGELGMLPPGDVRNCLLALADTEPLMEEIFNYRFEKSGDLKGHNVGNLIIAALNDKKGFKEALSSISRVLAVKGQVLPVVDKSLTLKAICTDGSELVGETNISSSKKEIDRIFIAEKNVTPLPEVLQAIKEADAIVFGPGSLYTSILPTLIVPSIPEAIYNSSAVKMYVSNIMTQPGETDDYTASEHVEAIFHHTGNNIIDTVLVNDNKIIEKHYELLDKYRQEDQVPVIPDYKSLRKLSVKTIQEDFSSRDSVIRHDSSILGKVIIKEVIKEKLAKDNKITSWPAIKINNFKRKNNHE
ncbi:gluconeogenesis factor YvcK family protein [Natranaerobius trueperi]|uniref:Putative gluconeogenesis factor n=1 Tax=Natranaerobius trueperi TaxID=759412 RepID=A0A226C027_9FIRM|nr:gluconeogenesis factor YvcK family protein [Natranaerobius trueperi]OWZ83799.1 hypothetical protein CDO51_06815 [Natranaerobius trueperi]